ncbi:hypothetical protein QAD02_018977 [Eretmocerus hayati]|uniref:Uncharacterized protein n=1 Tax=Eretmocerus hayati TaxID=131215 RepID=A0ACC2PHV3_9HYME|nr:hypothetical protein QAD02_018977 [Eretmocerus hayati]
MIGLSVFYIEYVSYEIYASDWPNQRCFECVTFLLVADPQIIGEQNEKYPGSSLAIWDSDRYLKKTFSRAVEDSQPDVILFLGDIMDEGHIASQSEFQKYEQRIENIFNTKDDIMKVYVPGDNDIGGEEDLVSHRKHERFIFTFGRQDSLIYKNILITKVNRLTETIPDINNLLNSKSNVTTIILSHLPLLTKPGLFVDKVIEKLSPKIIFTAHDHKGSYSHMHSANHVVSPSESIVDEKFLMQLKLDPEIVHELQIPTCSYRMGTLKMGYGLAHIDTAGGTFDFTILWLPNRFFQLLFYLIEFSLVSFFLAWTVYSSRNHRTYRGILSENHIE